MRWRLPPGRQMSNPPPPLPLRPQSLHVNVSVSVGPVGVMGGPEEKERLFSSRVIHIVFFTLLLDLLGFTLILPLFPSILEHYGQAEDPVYQSLQTVVDWFRDALGIPMERKYNTVLFGGLIGSLFSLLQFLSSPLTGAASDRYGRRPLLLLTTLGLLSSYAVWAVSRSFSMFLVFRVLGGLCKGNVSLCTAVVADLPCPKARNRGMAMIGIAFSLGFTVGPLMGAYFAVSGFEDLGDLLKPFSLFYFSALQVLGLVYFTYLFLFSGLEFTLSFLTHQRFHFTSMQQGKMFFFIGVIMALIQGGYSRRIQPGHHIKAVRTAIMALIPAFILVGLAWNLVMLYVGLALYAFAAAVVVPCLSTLVSDHGSAGQKGTVMGILRSLGALARALGPIVTSIVYWLAGAETCFILMAAMFILPLMLLSIAERLKTD
ncbi:hypothetical protein CRUP_021147 [Coryphaenoides rupestris]|nr:hypothetical protein CRUP_021147 [Coryphaenoides rupestris]